MLKIIEYIAKDSFQNADKITVLILNAIEKLERYLEMGSIVNLESTYTYRRILVKSFRVMYAFQNNKIYIALIQHQKRIPPQQINFIEKYL